MAFDLAAARDAVVSGPTIQLGSGGYFNFLDPWAGAMPTPLDIANGLAATVRFRGQFRRTVEPYPNPYTVAEHSVRMSRIVPPDHAYAALMHELAEAVMGDLVAPLKRICPDFQAIEERVEAALFEHYRVSPFDREIIKHADLVMLATERRDLMPNDGARWAILDHVTPLPEPIVPWRPFFTAPLFIRRYAELAPEGAPPVDKLD